MNPRSLPGHSGSRPARYATLALGIAGVAALSGWLTLGQASPKPSVHITPSDIRAGETARVELRDGDRRCDGNDADSVSYIAMKTAPTLDSDVMGVVDAGSRGGRLTVPRDLPGGTYEIRIHCGSTDDVATATGFLTVQQGPTTTVAPVTVATTAAPTLPAPTTTSPTTTVPPTSSPRPLPTTPKPSAPRPTEPPTSSPPAAPSVPATTAPSPVPLPTTLPTSVPLPALKLPAPIPAPPTTAARPSTTITPNDPCRSNSGRGNRQGRSDCGGSSGRDNSDD